MSRSQIDMIFLVVLLLQYDQACYSCKQFHNLTNKQYSPKPQYPHLLTLTRFCWVQHALCFLCHFVHSLRDSSPTPRTKWDISLAQPRFLLQFSILFNIHPFGVYLLSTSQSHPPSNYCYLYLIIYT